MEIQSSSSSKQSSFSSQNDNVEYENLQTQTHSKLDIECDLQQLEINAPIRRLSFSRLRFSDLRGLFLWHLCTNMTQLNALFKNTKSLNYFRLTDETLGVETHPYAVY